MRVGPQTFIPQSSALIPQHSLPLSSPTPYNPPPAILRGILGGGRKKGEGIPPGGGGSGGGDGGGFPWGLLILAGLVAAFGIACQFDPSGLPGKDGGEGDDAGRDGGADANVDAMPDAAVDAMIDAGMDPCMRPSVIGCWPMDEGTGTTANDLSGIVPAHNGTLVNDKLERFPAWI